MEHSVKSKENGNGVSISRINKSRVLNLIRREKEISRADIVKRTGISAPTVTRIVDSLLHNEQLIEQVGTGESNVGRPPLMVRFLGEENYVVGIDWGKTHIYGILANLNGEVLHELDVPSEVDNDFESDLAKVSNLIHYIIGHSGVDSEKIMGIGIAAAGYIDKHTGEVAYSPNFNWTHSHIKPNLEKEFGVPIKVDNVARVTALGELMYGHGHTYRDFIYINVGYGIGSGIIMDGKPHYGFDGYSGEIGHTRVSIPTHETRQCVCGKTDCLECYASGRGIAETVWKQLDLYPDSILHVLSQDDQSQITGKMVAKAAQSGDKLARQSITFAATALGHSISTVANILNPQAIILGGKIMKTGDLYLDRVKEVFNRETLRNADREIPVLLSANIDRGAAIGAVSLILKEVLDLAHTNATVH